MFHNTSSDLMPQSAKQVRNNMLLTQKSKWLSDADEILSHLQDKKISRPRQNKRQNETQINSPLQLLRQAYKIISNSEEKIAEQESRITHLEKIATTDELTGITNRRGFMSAFDRELDRVNRDKSQGGLLIMIDLDNFKIINDTYGHAAGDSALKIVAKTISTDIRRMDIAARLGGDEFVLLFANTDKKQSSERAQFLIKKLNNLSFIHEGNEINIRASLGLKNYQTGSKARHIFSCADADMYENKKHKKESELEIGTVMNN